MPIELQSTKLKRHSNSVNAKRAQKPIIIVGMMGAGKSTVGKRIAHFLGLDFIDSDTEIEKAAAMPVQDIFKSRGEDEFRAGEERVIKRLLSDHKNAVIATGGGAILSPRTQENIKNMAISIWLNADLDILFERVSRKDTRPLLKTPNPKQTLQNLIQERSPYYARADLTVMSYDATHEQIAADVIEQLAHYLNAPNQNQDLNAPNQNQEPHHDTH